jgi:triphosphoribosyl-dephospho-CoA synthase
VTSSVGLWAQLACVWEATARKPGNVHRFRDFADTTYLDFVHSAAAIASVFEGAAGRSIGATVLEAIRATRRVTRANTNLGIVLLLAPLAAVPEGERLAEGVGRALRGTTVEDARLVYEAIRLAAPGGLGRADEQDVSAEPTATLREVMALAAQRDQVARQYATDFELVLEQGGPSLLEEIERTGSLEGGIIGCQLALLARYPDSLIARKRGLEEARAASDRAQRVLAAGWPGTSAGWPALNELDEWLRAQGHARNPGTTADLVTACLFVLLREGKIELPLVGPWEAEGGRA